MITIPKSNEMNVWIGDTWKDISKTVLHEIMDKMIEMAIKMSCERFGDEIKSICFVQVNEPDLLGSDGCVCVRIREPNPTEKDTPERECIYHFKIGKTKNPQIIEDYFFKLKPIK